MLPTVTLALLHRDLLGLARSRWLRCKRVALVSLFTVGLLLALNLALSFGDARGLGLRCFQPLTWLLYALVLVIGPLAGLRAMGREWREQTIGLLLLTPDGALAVILGKVLGPLVSTTLAVLAALPAMFFCLSMGGLGAGQMLSCLLFLEVTLLLGLCLGLALGAAGHDKASDGGGVLLLLICQLILPAFFLMPTNPGFFAPLHDFLAQGYPPVLLHNLLRGTADGWVFAAFVVISIVICLLALRLAQRRIERQVRRGPVPAPRPAIWPTRQATIIPPVVAPRPAKAAAAGPSAPPATAPPVPTQRPPPSAPGRWFAALVLSFARPPFQSTEMPVAALEYWRHGWLAQPALVYGTPVLLAMGTLIVHFISGTTPYPAAIWRELIPFVLSAFVIFGPILLLGSWLSLNSQAFTRDLQGKTLELLLLTHLPDEAIWQHKQLAYKRVLKRFAHLLVMAILALLLYLALTGDLDSNALRFAAVQLAWLLMACVMTWALGLRALVTSLRPRNRRGLSAAECGTFFCMLVLFIGFSMISQGLQEMMPSRFLDPFITPLLWCLPPAGLGWAQKDHLRRNFRHLALASVAGQAA